MELEKIRERKKLPPKLRAVSDTLDEYLIRMHGMFVGWAHPFEFVAWLDKRGYEIRKKDHGN